MKNFGAAAFSAFVMVATTAMAQEAYPPSGYYAGLQGGLTSATDADLSAPALGGINPEIEFDTGFNIGVVGGYRSSYGLRLEGEYTYRSSDVDDVCISGIGCASTAGVAVGGDVTAHALMANIWWEPDIGGRILPYAGGGIGVAFLNIDASAGGSGFSSDATAFAYQAGAGIGYAVTPDIVGYVDYRWWGTSDADFDGVDATIGSHNVTLGIRYHF